MKGLIVIVSPFLDVGLKYAACAHDTNMITSYFFNKLKNVRLFAPVCSDK